MKEWLEEDEEEHEIKEGKQAGAGSSPEIGYGKEFGFLKEQEVKTKLDFVFKGWILTTDLDEGEVKGWRSDFRGQE